jgi:hypothetical protein
MDALFSKTVEAGKTTYFVDVKEAKNQKKYITISSSSPSKEDATKRSRKSIVIFDNAADELRSALDEAMWRTL